METVSVLLVLCAMNSPQKGQRRGTFVFSLICIWTNDWVNNNKAADLRRHPAHYDVTVLCTEYRRSLKKTEHDKRAYCALCFCGCYILVLRCQKFTSSWWRHQKETFAALLVLCAGNSHVPGEFPTQRPVTPSFEVFFDLRLNKWLSKQSIRRCFETPSRSLWRHCNMQYRWSLNRTEHNNWFYFALFLWLYHAIF